MSTQGNRAEGAAGRLAALFIDSKLTPIFIVASILLGAAAVHLLPREEEPQIKAPMIDVVVRMPGATAKEVEERVARPMEMLLWEVPGVEYLYSTSRPGEALVVVRFFVGEDLEESLVKLNQKLETNFDRIPHGVTQPLVKPRTIDDVPVLALTFHSPRYDHFLLRRLAVEVNDHIKRIPKVAETMVIGGARRQVRVQLDPLKLASRNIDAAAVAPMLRQANRQSQSGRLASGNEETLIETGSFISSAIEMGDIVVGVFQGKPVYLREVANLIDGPEEPDQYVLFGSIGTVDEPAVTLTVAKQPSANAVAVVDSVLTEVNNLKGTLIPGDVSVTLTRDYGATATEKSNELLFHMGLAVVGVSILIWVFLGFRESLIVFVVIPSTLALTLLVFLLHGYTLNRITLFAHIFSIGILVDDAIVVVENIVRHVRMPENRARPIHKVALEAVAEVGNPTILATLAVVAAILPMAFVGGLMGPYMRPIPIGSSAAMAFSLFIAFAVTPWAAVRLFKFKANVSENKESEDRREDFFTRLYRAIMGRLMSSALARWSFLGSIAILLLAAMALVGVGWVKVKMLPFDNKSEFQLILNMPEGSTLEQTTRVAREMAAAIRNEPEVAHYQVYAGTAAPFNFNGLVRRYFLRGGPNVADIQVNLVPKHRREAQSHDVAKRIRPRVSAIAARYGASVAVAEVPPGPPVLQTIVAEVYGPTPEVRLTLAKQVREIFESTEGIVDIDWYVENDQRKQRFLINKEKAALHGIDEATIAGTILMAVDGASVDLLHQTEEKEDINIVIELPREMRSRADDLLALRIGARDEPNAPLVPLRELVTIEETIADKAIYRKNLLPVIYITADISGAFESPVYGILEMNRQLNELQVNNGLQVYHLAMPHSETQPAVKWDGEWHITLEVFRDLGTAFAAVLILIYMLMVGWFRSFLTPVIVMTAIPFSLIGILPAHGALGAFFTATSMIGFMAGAGIVVRNSIILVDFIEMRTSEGKPLAEAVVEAGAVRFRPMLLTALAVVVGASVILFDPIFQGLALSLMAGEIASLFISRMAVPVIYFMANRK